MIKAEHSSRSFRHWSRTVSGVALAATLVLFGAAVAGAGLPLGSRVTIYSILCLCGILIVRCMISPIVPRDKYFLIRNLVWTRRLASKDVGDFVVERSASSGIKFVAVLRDGRRLYIPRLTPTMWVPNHEPKVASTLLRLRRLLRDRTS